MLDSITVKRIKINLNFVFKIIIIIVVLSLAGFFVFRIYNAKSALKIESSPEAIVYIDGVQSGKTPLEVELNKSEVEIKLIPEVFNDENVSYSTKVDLTKNVKTILRYKFGSGEIDSELLLVSFKRVGFGDAELAVVSIPDGASVRLNGKSEGVTPLKIDKVSETTHTLTVDANGYKATTFDVIPKSGYILTAFVDLASNDEQVKSILDRETEIEEVVEDPVEQYAYISDTPTGFLRVRKEPLLSSPEIGLVQPGDVYPLINKLDDWIEIEFEASVSGFISSEYATTSGKNQ